ncbi:hypothetical protein DFQ03_2833 [Maribacter caenipelagi]|uniref:Uncharacterized protein n=1 Tax=Maribacter caenipelagi TaxID=1447781 RepID=A0A4R7CYW7_9FLAO|nr:hypothetical protein [Maribacter caenipelagi]TDS13540.1 hypothetical protein DFQ03_2833 [Maribacter caenipelagi]
MKWYQPDKRWEIWGITTKEEFVDKYVVPGKFHDKVPKDVIEAFETVTYLMAHAYYHYEMLDVAVEKALLIMELALKLKAHQLKIPLKQKPNKKEVVYDKSLNTLIREVCKQKELSFLEPELNRARQWRNTKMHPKKHTVSGPIGYPHRNAKLFVNIINKLFMSNEQLSQIASKQKELQEKIKKFDYGLFILELTQRKILFTTIYQTKFLKLGSVEITLVFIQPVLKDVVSAIKNYDHTPLVIGFSKISIDNHRITGKDINGDAIHIYPNVNPENIPVWKQYERDWESLTEYEKREFNQLNAREALWKIEELTYQNCWN